MSCRCKERAAAIQNAMLAIARGDTAEARERAAYVARTAVEDAGSAVRQARAAAAARLRGKRWG